MYRKRGDYKLPYENRRIAPMDWSLTSASVDSKELDRFQSNSYWTERSRSAASADESESHFLAFSSLTIRDFEIS